MPLGKQAAAYTLASSFAMVAAKCRMLLPTPFQFSSPQLYLLVLLLQTLLPPFAKEVGVLYSHPIRDWGEEQGRPSVKIRRCITEELSLAAGKIFRAFQIVPPSFRAVWKSPWGLAFLCNPGYKTLLPPFFFGGSFCVSHSLRDCGEEQGRPAAKIRWCITGEPTLVGGKSFALSRLSRHHPGRFGKALGAWFSHAIRNIKHCSHLFSLRRGRE